MNKFFFIVLFISLLGFSLTGCSKPKAYKIGILSGLNFLSAVTDGLKEGLTDLGYIEGDNVVYDIQETNVDMDTYQSIIEKFVEDKVDHIFAFPTEAAVVAKKITAGSEIPVVFCYALIEELGLVDSLSKPGGNITGVRLPGPDIAAKRLEFMHEFVPGAKRYYVPYQAGYSIVDIQLRTIKPLAEEMGITIIEGPAASPGSFRALGEFAYNNNIPIGGNTFIDGEYISLFGINATIEGSGKEAAPLVNKILKQGIDPGTIPVVSAEMFSEIFIKVADRFGITVPDGLLQEVSKIHR